MTIEKKEEFINRIKTVAPDDKAKFGKMNVFQMICHCTDQLRMMFGEIKGLKRQNVDLVKIREMAARNETVPAPDGIDQAAGDGTKPTELENDKNTLISYLNRFSECDESYKFSFHPYMPGEMDKEKWDKLIVHHLNHHLGQFGR
jgi:hypothetical protein